MRYARFAVTLPLIALLVTAATWSPERSAADERAIRKLYDDFSAAIFAKDIDKVMSFYAKDPNLVFFDAFIPRQYKGAADYRRAYTEFFKLFPGKSSSKIDIAAIVVSGTMASSYGTDRWVVTDASGKSIEMVFRYTNLFRKVGGKWLITHEHLSFPTNGETAQADMMSTP